MPDVLSDADVGLQQEVLSDADVGLGTPQRNIEGEREDLRRQMREARAEAYGNKAQRVWVLPWRRG